MNRVVASAPGKLFLAGEYAVLERAPALVSAVDVRATCRLEAVAGDTSRIVTPPLSSTASRFSFRADRIAWQDDAVPLLDAAWEALDEARRTRLLDRAWNVSLDTSAFFIKDRKLGLGSSAAALAALMGALWAAGDGLPEGEKAYDFLQHAHAGWQGGGSGADLAVALSGGTILYRREPRVAAPVALPEHLALLPVWTGQSASTAEFLRELAAFREASPSAHAQCIALLSQQAEDVAVAVNAGDTREFIARFRSYGDALHAFGETSGLGVWSDVHRRIARLVTEAGGAYKPSGAGGGDVGLAVIDARDAAAVEGVKSALSSNGHEVLPLRFGARGLHLASSE